MESIKEVLCESLGYTSEEADNLVEVMRVKFAQGMTLPEVVADVFEDDVDFLLSVLGDAT